MGEFDDDIAAVCSIKTIPTILDVLCRTTGMRFAAVARVTEQRWIACSVRDDIGFGLEPGGELEIETTFCREIRQSGVAVIIDHVAEDADFRTHRIPAMYGFQSYISMPIRLADGSFFGTLCAIDPEPHRLRNPETVAMFEMFADMIGFHLSAIDRVKDSEAKLLNEQETSALREQFIAVLGHDLRNPLMAVSAGLELLLRRPAEAARMVPLLQQSVSRMTGLVDNIMDFARGRLGGGLTLQTDPTRPLEPTLQQVIAELRTTQPDRAVETTFAVHSPITCDHGRLAQLFSNLMGNAMTYGAADTPIRVNAKTDGAFFELSVSNGGEPIPPAVLEHLFQPFFRGEVRPSQEGLGLGLYIASEIARAHGGTLNAISTPAETRFTFRMPLQ
jgi:signal transduction histidine kinase